MYNVINTINSAIHMKVVMRLNPESSYHKKMFLFFFFQRKTKNKLRLDIASRKLKLGDR